MLHCELMPENIKAALPRAADRLIGVWFIGSVRLMATLLDLEWAQHAAAAKSLQPRLSRCNFFFCSYYFPGSFA